MEIRTQVSQCPLESHLLLVPGWAGDRQTEPKAALTALALSLQTIYGVYYVCPCERGLTCDGDKTIIGSITNTNYGICQDPKDKK